MEGEILVVGENLFEICLHVLRLAKNFPYGNKTLIPVLNSNRVLLSKGINEVNEIIRKKNKITNHSQQLIGSILVR